ncbi:MAG: hypothetical protein R3344_10835, partial [Acidobacteriota bacterium]|nr:hypothetical protein [Acidobacteriota bacterium]
RFASMMALIAVATTIAGCSAPRTPYACAIDLEQIEVDAQAQWECNREIIVNVVKGKKFTLRQFERASAFFESLTGVSADTVSGGEFQLPGAGLKNDLARWDAWYEENGTRLTWDPVERVVTVTPGGS